MRNISLCILNKDEGWAKAFLRTVCLDHPGFLLTIKFSCGDCDRGYDVCLDPDAIGVPGCVCAARPVCGKQAGVTALLAEAKAFMVPRGAGQSAVPGDFSFLLKTGEPERACVICVYARIGGAGASCAAIGVGRELARYRDVRACYLCLTDMESATLLPASCAAAMPAETLLYHCIRLASRAQNQPVDAKDLDGEALWGALIRAALIPDEYGLLRLGVDSRQNTSLNAGSNALSALTAAELPGLLALLERALGPMFFVLDFGTRGRLLEEFCEICEPQIFAVSRERDAARLPVPEGLWVIPECPEDVRHGTDRTDVALANAFGLKIKEMCDTLCL